MKNLLILICAIITFNSEVSYARTLPLAENEKESVFHFKSDTDMRLKVDYYRNGPYIYISNGNGLLIINGQKLDGYLMHSSGSDVQSFRESTELVVPRGTLFRFRLTDSHTFNGYVRLTFEANLGRIKLRNGDTFESFRLYQMHSFRSVRQAKKFINQIKAKQNSITIHF